MEAVPKVTPSTPTVQPPLISRRKFLSQMLAVATVPVVAGMYATKIEPFWLRFPEIPIKIKGLPKSFENYRIAQITDMHTGHTPLAFLQQSIAKVADLKTGSGWPHRRSGSPQCRVDREAVTELVKTFTVPRSLPSAITIMVPTAATKKPTIPTSTTSCLPPSPASEQIRSSNESTSINHPDGKLVCRSDDSGSANSTQTGLSPTSQKTNR